jgi:exonuclease V gamma subunit
VLGFKEKNDESWTAGYLSDTLLPRSCGCHLTYLYNLRSLPENMLTDNARKSSINNSITLNLARSAGFFRHHHKKSFHKKPVRKLNNNKKQPHDKIKQVNTNLRVYKIDCILVYLTHPNNSDEVSDESKKIGASGRFSGFHYGRAPDKRAYRSV